MEYIAPQKIAAIQSDLVAAAAQSKRAFYKTLVRKVAEIGFTPEEAEFAAITLKTAEPGGNQRDDNTTSTLKKLLIGAALLTPPIAATAKYISGRMDKSRGWDAVSAREPQLIANNPERARAIYDLIHSTSPEVSGNTPIAADLMRQMLSVPQIDIGTLKGMSDIRKNMSGGSDGKSQGMFLDTLGGVKTVNDASNVFQSAFKESSKRAGFGGMGSMGGGPTQPNFVGDGLPQQQANSADMMNQQASMSGSLLPLDTAIREILAKEQELMQREQVLSQQEQQIQMYAQQLQGGAQGFGQEFGVDPQTGQDVDPAAPQMAGGGGPDEMGGMPPDEMGGMPPDDTGGMPTDDTGGMPPGTPSPMLAPAASPTHTIQLPLTISVSLGGGGGAM